MDAQDEVDEVEPVKLPKWMKATSWLEATVDCSVFGLGNVYLTDATPPMVQEWIAASNKPGGSMSSLAVAKLLAAYVDHADDPSFPAKGSGWQKWESWLNGGVRQKLVKRITESIFAFMRHVGDESNQVPN